MRHCDAIRAKSPDHSNHRQGQYSPSAEEAKDGTVSGMLDREAIMAIVDEPFSTSVSEHRELYSSELLPQDDAIFEETRWQGQGQKGRWREQQQGAR